MTTDEAFLSDTIALLERTPRVARDLLNGMPEAWLNQTDVPGGWRPRDVVGHLTSAEMTNWMPRVERILESGTALPFDPFDQFAHESRDADLPLDELLEQFATLRAANLARLRTLVTADDLERRGLHPAFGEVTMHQLLSTWAVHDLDHLSQAFAGMAASHDADVGPWKAYAGILLRRDDPSAVAG